MVEQGRNPIPAVDIIIQYENGVVLIQRGDGAWALPGGFVELGETVEHAAKREAGEETNLTVSGLALFDVYSDPERDPRAHIITTVFTATGTGELVAGDDATNAAVFPVEEALEKDLAFDHGQILRDWQKR